MCWRGITRVYCYYDVRRRDFEGVDAIWDGAGRQGDTHVISLRKAERYETRYYLEAAQDSLGKAD
jgi:hypothetical protein